MLGCRPMTPQELPSVQLGLSLEPNLGPTGYSVLAAEGTVEVSGQRRPLESGGVSNCWSVCEFSVIYPFL